MSNKDLGKVIAIQVAPFKELEQGSVEVQFDGADADTDGYGIYLRHENGMAMHSRDCPTEAAAIRVARELCKEFSVKVEPYGWQVGLVHMGPDIVVDDTRAFEAFARKQDFIKDVQRYDYKHPHWPGEYGHVDTKHAKVMWDGGVAWTLAILGHFNMPRNYLNGNEIRVSVEGRVGVGKSALCGFIEDALQTVGVTVEWIDAKYEKEMTEIPWQQALIESNASVKIVERPITASLMQDLIASRDVVSKLVDEASRKPYEPVSSNPNVLSGSDEEIRMFIETAVDCYINPNMLNLDKDDPDRDTKVAAFKASLIEHLMNDRNSRERFDVRVKHFLKDYKAQ